MAELAYIGTLVVFLVGMSIADAVIHERRNRVPLALRINAR